MSWRNERDSQATPSFPQFKHPFLIPSSARLHSVLKFKVSRLLHTMWHAQIEPSYRASTYSHRASRSICRPQPYAESETQSSLKHPYWRALFCWPPHFRANDNTQQHCGYRSSSSLLTGSPAARGPRLTTRLGFPFSSTLQVVYIQHINPWLFQHWGTGRKAQKPTISLQRVTEFPRQMRRCSFQVVLGTSFLFLKWP